MNWTPAQLAAHAAGKFLSSRRHKYDAQATTVDGIRFASKRESEVYKQLSALALRGVIHKLELQPRFILQEAFTDKWDVTHKAIHYVADFGFIGQNGEPHVIDVKGLRTPVYALKRKLFARRYPDIIFQEVR